MKQLKTLLIAAALFIGASQTISAQAKIAHINVSELMTSYPDMKTAQDIIPYFLKLIPLRDL